MTEKAPEALHIPLHGLYYVPDPRAFAVPDAGAREFLLGTYAPEKILEIFDALVWAVRHPDYPFLAEFADAIPDMTYDNETIVGYFEKLIEGMRPVVEALRPGHSGR
jgi:hypothetical protein